MITIDPDLLDDLFYVAQAASPQECCGLLLAECGDEHRIIECELLRNEAQDAVSTIYVSASRIADVAAVLEGRYAASAPSTRIRTVPRSPPAQTSNTWRSSGSPA